MLDADATADVQPLFNTNSIILGITILFVIVCIVVLRYRREKFFKKMGEWQDSYSALRPPGAASAPGYFLLK
jgi:hypothetical protein